MTKTKKIQDSSFVSNVKRPNDVIYVAFYVIMSISTIFCELCYFLCLRCIKFL